jgi:hypothetical protein
MVFNCLISASNAAYPAAVIGTFSKDIRNSPLAPEPP